MHRLPRTRLNIFGADRSGDRLLGDPDEARIATREADRINAGVEPIIVAAFDRFEVRYGNACMTRYIDQRCADRLARLPQQGARPGTGHQSEFDTFEGIEAALRQIRCCHSVRPRPTTRNRYGIESI